MLQTKKKFVLLVALIALSLTVLAPGMACAAVWVGAPAGDWFTAGNWSSPATVPTTGGEGATIRDNTMDFSAPGATARFLAVGGPGVLNILGGDLTYVGDGLVGSTSASTNGAGTVNQSAGTVTQTGGGVGLIVGHTRVGEWNLSGGTLNPRVQTYLGWDTNDASGSKIAVTGTGVFSGGQSVLIGRSGEFSYTGGTGSGVAIQNDLRVGLNRNGAAAPGTLTLGGAGGTFNLGSNLTFDHSESKLNVVLDASNVPSVGGGLNAFNTLNANGTIMMIKTDPAGVTGADLNVVLDVDLPLGSYEWKIIDLIGTGEYGVSGTYFQDNYTAAAGPAGYFNGLANDATFSVFSTPTNTEYTFRINYDGGSGNDLVLSTTGIPEPGTWLLLLSALACGMLVRRRR